MKVDVDRESANNINSRRIRVQSIYSLLRIATLIREGYDDVDVDVGYGWIEQDTEDFRYVARPA